MLEWLNDILQALLKFVPRILIIPTTHAGVKFRRGKVVVELEPGINIWWPLISLVVTYPVERQTVNLERQTLTTKDGIVVGLSGIVVYKIRNIVAFLTNTWDGEDTIRDLALSAIASVVSQTNFADLHSKLGDGLAKDLQQKLHGFGVQVIKLSLSDFFVCDFMLGTWAPGLEAREDG